MRDDVRACASNCVRARASRRAHAALHAAQNARHRGGCVLGDLRAGAPADYREPLARSQGLPAPAAGVVPSRPCRASMALMQQPVVGGPTAAVAGLPFAVGVAGWGGRGSGVAGTRPARASRPGARAMGASSVSPWHGTARRRHGGTARGPQRVTVLHGRGCAGMVVGSGHEQVLDKIGKLTCWVRVAIIGVYVAPSGCRCGSSSLAGDLGRCLAGGLVVCLLTHASALHALHRSPCCS